MITISIHFPCSSSPGHFQPCSESSGMSMAEGKRGGTLGRAPRRNALGEGRAAGSGGAEHFRRPPASPPHGRVCGESGPGRELPGTGAGERGVSASGGCCGRQGGRGSAGRPPGASRLRETRNGQGRAAAPQHGLRAGAAPAFRGSGAARGPCGAASACSYRGLGAERGSVRPSAAAGCVGNCLELAPESWRS